jgi:hypothetical protein
MQLIAKLLTPTTVFVLCLLSDSERYHNWLWNAIDHSKNPEPLWAIQSRFHKD